MRQGPVRTAEQAGIERPCSLCLVTGMTDLQTMLRTLTVSRRPGRYIMTGPMEADEATALSLEQVEALISEAEGWTAIVKADAASTSDESEHFAWLTLDVHSSLHAVGLTAAVSSALADAGIPANMVAAFHHDHLLVPTGRAAEALEVLAALRVAHQATD